MRKYSIKKGQGHNTCGELVTKWYLNYVEYDTLYTAGKFDTRREAREYMRYLKTGKL